MQKKCQVCGKIFDGKTSAKLCDECKEKERHVACVVCGKEFVATASQMYVYKDRGWLTCSKSCATEMRKRTCQERYGVDFITQTEEHKKKVKSTNLERYGVESALQNPEIEARRERTNIERYGSISPVANKEVKERMRQTCDERYGGIGYASKEINKRARETTKERYGVEYSSQSPEFIKKRRETSMERHGYATPLNDPKVLEKTRQTLFERTGYYTPGCNDSEQRIREYHEQHPEATISDVAEALGMTYAAVQLQNLEKGIGLPRQSHSSFEKKIAEYLDSLGVNYKQMDRTVIAPQELDFYCPDEGVAIEVNDFWTHNSTRGVFGSTKPKRYHWDKTRDCEENGVRLIHCWEHCLPGSNVESGKLGSWEVMKDIIAHALGKTKHTHYARNMKVVEFAAPLLKDFFNKNNINGYRGANTAYCLVDKDIAQPTPQDVIMAYAVGKSQFAKKHAYDAEIIRGACLLGHNVIGGASKLWSYIIEHTDYESIVYYVDRNYYAASSMDFLENVEYIKHVDSFWNYWVNDNALKNREPRKHAYIKEQMALGNVWQVYNAGTDVFVWHKK